MTDSSPADPPPTAPPRQVSLRFLFLTTTYFAVSFALAARWGVGWLVPASGIYLTWLSVRGYLTWLQTREASRHAYLASWLLFAISLGLPALTVQGCNQQRSTVYGWEAVYFGGMGIIETTYEAATWVADEERWTGAEFERLVREVCQAWYMSFPNLLLVLSPWIRYRQRIGKGAIGSSGLGVAAAFTWLWSVCHPDTTFGTGYYLWTLSVTLLFLAYRPGWRSAVAIAGTAVSAYSLIIKFELLR